MIRSGDRLENAVTGEVLVFHRTAAETGGESVVVETILRPDAFVAAAHVHPYQTERFEVLEGSVGFRVGGEDFVAGPGAVAVVPPGTPHSFRNAGDGQARFLCEVTPALQFESLIETMFTLAAEGKTNRKGLPSPLRLAVIARAHFDTVRLPFPPAALQRAALAVGAVLGKALGYPETVPAPAR
jgi:quercetin dioxygenase-like cupin family protein